MMITKRVAVTNVTITSASLPMRYGNIEDVITISKRLVESLPSSFLALLNVGEIRSDCLFEVFLRKSEKLILQLWKRKY